MARVARFQRLSIGCWTTALDTWYSARPISWTAGAGRN
jgi:hypothetical protein